MAYVPAHTLVGKACYTGLVGTVVTGNLIATKTVLNGASLNRSTPKAMLKDGAGNILSKAYANPTDTLDVKFTPVSAAAPPTRSDAASNVLLPAIGTQVTLGDTGIAAFDGAWNYDGDARITSGEGQPIEISMTISRVGTPDGSGNPTALAAVA